MMFRWLSTTSAERFGKDLAEFILTEAAGSLGKTEAKFAGRVTKVLIRADQRVYEFKQREALNFYQRAKLSNAFLWTLKDRGATSEFADKLTEWLAMRL